MRINKQGLSDRGPRSASVLYTILYQAAGPGASGKRSKDADAPVQLESWNGPITSPTGNDPLISMHIQCLKFHNQKEGQNHQPIKINLNNGNPRVLQSKLIYVICM